VTARTVAAIRDKDTDDPIALHKIARSRSCLDYLTRRFVTQHHRHDSGAATIYDAEIGMAEAGGANANEHLARSRRIEFAQFDA